MRPVQLSLHLSTADIIEMCSNSAHGSDLQINYDNLTKMPKLRSTYDGRLLYKTSYNEWKAFHRKDSCAKSSEEVFVN